MTTNTRKQQVSKQQRRPSDQSEELQYIYCTLRQLSNLKHIIGSDRTKHIDQLTPSISVFPKRFLYKLLNERLEDLNDLAQEIAINLFKQIGGKPKRSSDIGIGSESSRVISQRESQINARFPELDEYFHYCLHYLHDFLIDFNWHEPDVDVVSNSDQRFIDERLNYIKQFQAFQKVFNNLLFMEKSSSAKNVTNVKTATESLGSTLSFKLKSNLSIATKSPKLESPTARRRVRFKGLEAKALTDGHQDQRFQELNRQILSDNHSCFAFNLLLFAINQFIQQLSNQLVDWLQASNLIDSTRTLLESKQKLRTNQLQALVRRIKVANDVYLTVLDYLNEIKETYLINRVLGTLNDCDSERLNDLYKRPRIKLYNQKIGLDVESKILFRLANQFLQILFDLIVGEINLPPIELDSGTQTRSREEIAKGQVNLTNFIASWLRIDDILFGFLRPKQQSVEVHENVIKRSNYRNNQMASSSLFIGNQFKSSSRILAQMDNLGELMREILVGILSRLRNDQQTRYLIELIYSGLDQAFGIISAQLLDQLNATQSMEAAKTLKKQQDMVEKTTARTNQSTTDKDLESLASSVDIISAKIRCLKLAHVMNSACKILGDAIAELKIDKKIAEPLESRLIEFARVAGFGKK